MPNPAWFTLDAARVKTDAGVQKHQIGDGTLTDEEFTTLIERYIASVVQDYLAKCKRAAGELSFPSTDDELKKALSPVVVWPVIVSWEDTLRERCDAEREARQASIDAGHYVPHPVSIKFEAQTGDPDDNTAITQDDIDDFATTLATARAERIAEQKANFTQAVSEMVMAKLWYSVITGDPAENGTAKGHLITSKTLLGNLTAELETLTLQHRMARGAAFF